MMTIFRLGHKKRKAAVWTVAFLYRKQRGLTGAFQATQRQVPI